MIFRGRARYRRYGLSIRVGAPAQDGFTTDALHPLVRVKDVSYAEKIVKPPAVCVACHSKGEFRAARQIERRGT